MRFPLAVVAMLMVAITACDSGSSSAPASDAPASLAPTSPVLPISSGATRPGFGSPAHAVIGPHAGRGQRRTLDVLSGATSVRVRTAELGGALYRVSTPNGTAVYPSAHQTGSKVDVTLSGGGNGELLIQINPDVIWNLRFTAGASEIDAALPKATAHQTVTEVGGTSAFRVRLPAHSRIVVRAIGGASQVTLAGQRHSGVAGGTVFTSGHGAPGYTINAVGGVSSLTVTG